MSYISFPKIFQYLKEYCVQCSSILFTVNQNGVQLSEYAKVIVYKFIFLRKEIDAVEAIRKVPL